MDTERGYGGFLCHGVGDGGGDDDRDGDGGGCLGRRDGARRRSYSARSDGASWKATIVRALVRYGRNTLLMTSAFWSFSIRIAIITFSISQIRDLLSCMFSELTMPTPLGIVQSDTQTLFVYMER